ncbi:hypothetical protein ACS0TY_014928 [Phlomoides rotata]
MSNPRISPNGVILFMNKVMALILLIRKHVESYSLIETKYLIVMRNSTIIFDGIVKPFKEKTRVVSSAFRKIAKHNILSVFSLRSRHVLTDSKVVVQYYLSRTPL